MNQKTQGDVLRQCREIVLDDAPEITKALVAQAKKGSYQHAKFVFDFAFAAEEKTATRKSDEEDRPGPSLAQILLQRLEEVELEDQNPESDAPCDA